MGHIKEVLLTSAEKVLGLPKAKWQIWVMKEVLGFCDHRRTLKSDKLKTLRQQLPKVGSVGKFGMA